MIRDLDLKKFLQDLTEKTNQLEIEWKKAPKVYDYKFIDRPISDVSIKEPFYTDGKNARVIVGRYQNRIYYEEDEYYLEDHFFITITNTKFDHPVSFLEGDDEIPLGLNFALSVSKLHRLIQISSNDIKNRLDNFFD